MRYRPPKHILNGLIVLAMAAGIVIAQEKAYPWSGVTITISANDDVLRQPMPLGVDVAIRNEADKPFPLKGSYLMVLRKVSDRSVAAFSPLSFDPDSDPSKKQWLSKGERVGFYVDLTGELWAKAGDSGKKRADLFKLLEKGEYLLTAEIWNPDGAQSGPSAQNIVSSAPVPISYKTSKSDWSGVSIKAATDSSKLVAGRPFPVSIRIENNSDRHFPLENLPVLVLKNVEAAAANREANGDCFISQTVDRSRSNLSKKEWLAKGESVEFVVSLEDLKWKDLVSSLSNRFNLFSVLTSGDYQLTAEILQIEDKAADLASNNIASEPITIAYKK